MRHLHYYIHIILCAEIKVGVPGFLVTTVNIQISPSLCSGNYDKMERENLLSQNMGKNKNLKVFHTLFLRLNNNSSGFRYGSTLNSGVLQKEALTCIVLVKNHLALRTESKCLTYRCYQPTAGDKENSPWVTNFPLCHAFYLYLLFLRFTSEEEQ